MKKIISLFLSLVIASALLVPVNAAGSPSIALSNESASAGKSITLTVSLNDSTGIAGIVATLQYDTSVLTLTQAKNSELFSGFSTGKNIAWDDYRNIVGSGALATLTFAVSEDAAAGTYPVSLIVRSCSDEALQKVELNTVAGSITVSDNRVYGDADGSGKVDASDITMIAQYIAGGYGITYIDESICDVDGSGKVDASDITMIAQYIAGGYGITELGVKR